MKPATCGSPRFGGVSHLSGGHFENFANLTSGLLNDICYGVAVQGKFVWVATTAGISRYNKETGEWTDWSEKNAPFHEPWTYGIVPAPEIGKVYFAMWGGGLIEYDDNQGYMKAYTDPDEEMEIVLFKNQGLIHIIVSGVAWNPDTKMVWASTYFGLSGYDGRNWHNYLTKDSGLASDFINAPKSRAQRGLGLHGQGAQHARLLDQHLGHLPAQHIRQARSAGLEPGTCRPQGRRYVRWPKGGTPSSICHGRNRNHLARRKERKARNAHGPRAQLHPEHGFSG